MDYRAKSCHQDYFTSPVNITGLIGAAFQWWGGAARSSRWSAVRAGFLAQHSQCAACGRKEDLEAHHIVPFHLQPGLELDVNNLIVLCRSCHHVFGHLGDWGSWNTSVREDAARYLVQRQNRPG